MSERASFRKHILAGGMLAMLVALTAATIVVARDDRNPRKDSFAPSEAGAVTGTISGQEAQEQRFRSLVDAALAEPKVGRELSVLMGPWISPLGGDEVFAGDLNGITIDPAPQPSIRSFLAECPLGDRELLSDKAAEDVATAAGDLAIPLGRLPTGLTLSSATAGRCAGTIQVVEILLLITLGTKGTRGSDSPLQIRRIRDSDIAYHAAPASRWFSYPAEANPKVATWDQVPGDGTFVGCFAAELDAATGVLTTVSAPNGEWLFCHDILKSVATR